MYYLFRIIRNEIDAAYGPETYEECKRILESKVGLDVSSMEAMLGEKIITIAGKCKDENWQLIKISSIKPLGT